MSKTALLAAFLIAGFAPTAFAPTAFAQTPTKPEKNAMKAKKRACEAEVQAKKLEQPQRKEALKACLAR